MRLPRRSRECWYDSIDSIEIIVGIENLFGVDISGAGATREDFRSIETLTAFVEAHKED